jgi:hypothetical protein
MQKRWCIYWCLNMFRQSSCPSSGEQYEADNACGVQQSWNQSQQVHTEPPLLPESAAARPVLYTIGVVGFVLFSWWWAWWFPKHVETPINISSFLHLVGYLFTFMIQDARSHEIKVCFIFCVFCIVLCIVSSFVYCCLFPISVQVYRPLKTGGNPIA